MSGSSNMFSSTSGGNPILNAVKRPYIKQYLDSKHPLVYNFLKNESIVVLF